LPVSLEHKRLHIFGFMKQILLFVASCLFTAPGALAKGHVGGHGGGHSSNHSGGGHTSTMHAAPSHSNIEGSRNAGRNAAPTKTKLPLNRSTPPRTIAANHATNMPIYHNGVPLTPPNGEPPINSGTGSGPSIPSYPSYYYGYYNPYYGDPFYYNPYFDMWSLGFSMMYSPTYPYLGGSSGTSYDEGNSNDGVEDDMEGYVVYARDTISGAISLRTNTVFLATKDSSGSYDYKFRIGNKELEYVTAFNSEDKQVKLVRLDQNKRKLWRVVHEGKLNLYDDAHGFIYRPEDIDKMSLVAEFNGTTKTMRSFYGVKSKDQLTEYVNEAYGLHLDPKNFTWNQLLIYLDKLD
jgi:hypothetical protein